VVGETGFVGSGAHVSVLQFWEIPLVLASLVPHWRIGQGKRQQRNFIRVMGAVGRRRSRGAS
jgi:hypothetical protein